MNYAFFAVSKEGLALVSRMQLQFFGELRPLTGIKSALAQSDALVFVMATGMVMRHMAPFIESRETRPAVLVIDQKGRYVIPLLSGLQGEANDIAEGLAKYLGAQPVITTATDPGQMISFARVAKENELQIIHPDALKRVHSLLMQGVILELHSDHEIARGSHETDQNSIRIIMYDPEDFRQILRGYHACVNAGTVAVFLTSRALPALEDGAYPPNILILSPQDIVVGIGCHSRVNEEYMYDTLKTTLGRQNLPESAIRILATTPMKAKEPAILALSKRIGVPLVLVETDEIRKVEYRFKQAPFEKQPAHAGNVGAPCAYLASEKGHMLLVGMTFPGGVTLAIAQERKIIQL